jgi:DNA-binding XRE family transcriptional regulator
MAISDKIKEYRVKRGMTQAQLTELLGVTLQQSQNVKRQQAIPIYPSTCKCFQHYNA